MANRIQPDDRRQKVSLTPQGRLIWEQFLAEASAYAGRAITPDEVGRLLQRLRAETGDENPDFRDERVRKRFMRLIRKACNQ